jgi:hypothetical protein
MKHSVHSFLSLLWLLGGAMAVALPVAAADPAKAQITVLYDAFGKTSNMQKDWGFSAFIEYGGKRILFDTGNNAEIFAHNVKAKGIDLTKLDFAVVSHRHGDHTSGLNYLMTVNPGVKIYVPKENFGVFGAALPGTFYKRDESLPVESNRSFQTVVPQPLSWRYCRSLDTAQEIEDAGNGEQEAQPRGVGRFDGPLRGQQRHPAGVLHRTRTGLQQLLLLAQPAAPGGVGRDWGACAG